MLTTMPACGTAISVKCRNRSCQRCEKIPSRLTPVNYTFISKTARTEASYAGKNFMCITCQNDDFWTNWAKKG